jgi:hypothetical protein
MRRVHLRGKKNIAKRALIHAEAFNLSLILRIVLGVGAARQAADRLAAVCFWFLWLVETERRDHQHPTCLTWLPQSLSSFILMLALNPALSTDC